MSRVQRLRRVPPVRVYTNDNRVDLVSRVGIVLEGNFERALTSHSLRHDRLLRVEQLRAELGPFITLKKV